MNEKIKQGKNIYGIAVTSPSALWADSVKRANLDFVFIDTEHYPMCRETVSNMCHTYTGLGITPMVRIPSVDPDAACMVLDGGAQAVLVPYIESVEQVKAMVGAVKYRPLKGLKLKRILDGDETLTAELREYVNVWCKNNMLFINIESKPAVENITELLSVPGLDGIIIGPHDLSCSYDVPEQYDCEIFESAVEKIIKECKTRELPVGIHLPKEPEQQIKWANRGINVILHSSDISLFGKILDNEMNYIRNELKDELSKGNDNFII